jgi:hypothetical protein
VIPSRDYTGVAPATLPEVDAADFQPRLRSMISDIDYYLRDSSRGFARIQLGQVPDGSGNPIGSNGALTDYFFLPGRSPGQIAYFNSASGGGGTLSSNPTGSKGKILLGASSAFDEANVRLGIGTATPTAILHWVGSASTTYARPTTTSGSINNWKGQDGGTVGLASYVNESTLNESTYVTESAGSAGSAITWVFWTAGSNPISGTPTITLTFRIRRDPSRGNAGTEFIQFTLFRAATTITSQASLTTFTTAWADYAYTLSGSEATALDVNHGTDGVTMDMSVGGIGGPGGYDVAQVTMSMVIGGSTNLAHWYAGTNQVGTINSHGRLFIKPDIATDAILVQNLAGATASELTTSGQFYLNSQSQTSHAILDLSAAPSLGTAGHVYLYSGNNSAAPDLAMFGYNSQIPQVMGDVNGGTPQLRIGNYTSSVAKYAMNVGVNGLGTVAINPSDHSPAASVPLTVYGSTTQSGHLQDWKTVAGVVLSGVSATGSLLMGDTSGTSYYAVVPGDDLTVQDDAGLNLLTVRDTTSWADSVAGYQMLPGNAAPTNRNLQISGFSASGSVFDRLGIQAVTTMIWDGTAAAMPAPVASPGLLELRSSLTTKILLRLKPTASSSVSTLLIRNTGDTANTVAIARDGATVISPAAGIALTLTPPSGQPKALLSSFTDTAWTANATNEGIWYIKPTLSNAAGWGGATNVLAINATVSNLADAGVRGLFMNLSASQDATASGLNSLVGLRYQVTTTGTSGAVWADVNSVQGQVTTGGGDIHTQVTGVRLTLTTNAAITDASSGNLFGVHLSELTGTGSMNRFRAINLATPPGGIGTPGDLFTSGPTCTDAHGIFIGKITRATNNTGIEIDTIAGTAGTNIGIAMANVSGGATANWSLAIGTSSSAGPSYHYAPFRFGDNTAPTHRLDLAAGTTTIAPIKLTSATAITSPVAGCLEFTTDDYFATITTGTARKAFVLDDGTRLTSGRVPFATTNGRLTDDADMTFSTDTLTVTKLVVGGGASIAAISHGVYTPTRSAEANLDANVTMTQAQYERVGSVVTVSGRFTADPTLTATATSFEMTLPIASNLGAVEDCSGVAACGNIVSMSAEIIGVIANDTAKIQWKASDVTSQTWSYTFTYRII